MVLDIAGGGEGGERKFYCGPQPASLAAYWNRESIVGSTRYIFSSRRSCHGHAMVCRQMLVDYSEKKFSRCLPLYRVG